MGSAGTTLSLASTGLRKNTDSSRRAILRFRAFAVNGPILATKVGPGSVFTLIIPTYNRPLLLQRLLAYLGKSIASFPILVLDSSEGDCARQNANLVTRSTLKIEHVEYPPTTAPFSKFADGFNRVETRYSALCADDDVILLQGLASAVEFLEAHQNYAVAHGHYFDFTMTSRKIVLERWRYADDDSLTGAAANRVLELIRRYRALTYAVVRTDVAAHAFACAAEQKNILEQELLSGLICAMGGKVKRLPVAFYGRRNERITEYANAHPLQRIITSAPMLFSDYRDLSHVALEAFRNHPALREPQLPLAKSLLDLYSLRYIFGHVHAPTLDLIIDRKLDCVSDRAILEEARFVQADSENDKRCAPMSRKLRMLKYRALPNFRFRLRGFRLKFWTPPGVDLDYRRRGYQVEPDFAAGLNDLSLPVPQASAELLHALDLYR
jgi:glycosyltransferase domain-containing protein